jgi:hypothetical protein
MINERKYNNLIKYWKKRFDSEVKKEEPDIQHLLKYFLLEVREATFDEVNKKIKDFIKD